MMKAFNRIDTARAAAGLAALAVVCLQAVIDRRTFLACWLADWWACIGIVLGSRANLWLHDLSGGAWGLMLRPIWRRASAAMPAILLLTLPVIAAVWTLYPWSDPAWRPESRVPAFQALWLSPSFVTARLIVYAGIWQVLCRAPAHAADPPDARKGRSALGLIVYGLSVGLAAVDLVQSLLPQWHSSGFGLIVVSMQMKCGFALSVAGAAASGRWRASARAAETAPRGETAAASPAAFPAQLGRDWGNMLLMYVMMWAYLAYVQFLIIWAENLPDEISWYVPRLQTRWAWLGISLAAVGFFIPLLLLLMRAMKQNRRCLGTLAIVISALGWLESIWIVLPSVPGLGGNAWWMAPLTLASMAGLLWAAALPSPPRRTLKRHRSPAIPQKEARP